MDSLANILQQNDTKDNNYTFMNNKLQELTERLYNEGLSKGKQDAEQLLAKAQSDAEKIVAAAKAEAQQIVAKAQESADQLKSKAESDIKMASEQSLQATKKDIENLLVDATISEKVKSSLADSAFIKEIILTVAKKFTTEQSLELSLILPATLKDELEAWVSSELSKTLKSEVKAEFSKKIQGGFTIGPKDGSWFVNLTDESFKELIAEYLRPVTKKLLFG